MAVLPFSRSILCPRCWEVMAPGLAVRGAPRAGFVPSAESARPFSQPRIWSLRLRASLSIWKPGSAWNGGDCKAGLNHWTRSQRGFVGARLGQSGLLSFFFGSRDAAWDFHVSAAGRGHGLTPIGMEISHLPTRAGVCPSTAD